MTVSLSFLLFLAQLAARALALVGGRAFARVARKGTIEHAHYRALVRRLHAKGKLGAGTHGFVDLMRQLCHCVAMVARFNEVTCPRIFGPAIA